MKTYNMANKKKNMKSKKKILCQYLEKSCLEFVFIYFKDTTFISKFKFKFRK